MQYTRVATRTPRSTYTKDQKKKRRDPNMRIFYISSSSRGIPGGVILPFYSPPRGKNPIGDNVCKWKVTGDVRELPLSVPCGMADDGGG